MVQADGAPNKIGQLYHELLYGTPAANEGAHGDDLAAEEDLYEESVEELLRPTAPEGAAGEPVRPGHLARRFPCRTYCRNRRRRRRGVTTALSGRAICTIRPPPCTSRPGRDSRTIGAARDSHSGRRATAAGDGRGGAGQGTDGSGPRRGQSCGADWEGRSPETARRSGASIRQRMGHDPQGAPGGKRGRRPVLVQSGETYRFVVDFIARKPLPSVCISFLIRTSWGIDIIGTDTRFIASPGRPERMRSGERCRAVFELPLSFAPGTYFFTMSVVGTDETKYDHWFDCLSFTVAPTPLQLYTTSLLSVPISSRASLMKRRAKGAEASAAASPPILSKSSQV